MAAFAVVAFINFLLGGAALFVVQTWVLRRRPEAEITAVPLSPISTQPMAAEPAQQQPNWLALLMEKVEGDISRHAFEIDELATELSGASADDPESILAAAATMLVANRRLQSDLAMAHE